MHALYRQQRIRCTRSDESFSRHLHNWRRQPIVVRDSAGRIAGYSCYDPKDASCVECCFESNAALETFLCHQVAAAAQPLRLFAPLIRDARFNRLDDLADDCSVIEASNWRIYDWPAVFGALLKAKHDATPLVPGSCVITVNAAPDIATAAGSKPITFRMSVDDQASCNRCDDPPDLEADAAQVLRLLAGPLPSELPRRASVLAHWRPLPLMIPMQDRI